AEHEAGVHRVVDVALLDVGVETSTCAGKDVTVAGAVDDDLGHQRLTAFLALKDDALDRAFLDNRHSGPRMEDDAAASVDQHFLRGQLEAFRIDGRSPGDDAVEGRGAQTPVLGERFVLDAPDGTVRTSLAFVRQTVEHFFGKTADNQIAVPVGHAVDPDDDA